MDGLEKLKFHEAGRGVADVFGVANARFTVIYEFCKGDLTKDIFRELIHNEMNMRPSQINQLFNVSGLSDVCGCCSDKQSLLDQFGVADAGKAHGKLVAAIEDFFERRNDIAHALNPGQSNGPEQIAVDIDMLKSFAKALCETLEAAAPPPLSAPGPDSAAASGPGTTSDAPQPPEENS